MSDFRDVTFGEHLFSRIDDNAYLQKLYHNILINYSRRLFRLDEIEEQPVNIGDALTFADVLSKSCGTNLSDIHKTRAQEMVALLWYEFVEYGTTNRLRIILQRSGFKRDSTEYIRRNADKYVRGTPDNPKLLKKELLECPNELVRRDTEEIQYYVPELFIDEGEE